MLGVPDAAAVGATFLVLKRGRELVWVLFGYAWMAWEARRYAARTAPRRSDSHVVEGRVAA